MLDLTIQRELFSRYYPTILTLVDNNLKYFGFKSPPQLQFACNENIAYTCVYRSQTDTLIVNPCFLDFCYENKKEPLHVEFYILHELRHRFQFRETERYSQNEPTNVDSGQIKSWQNNYKKYISPNSTKDGNGDYYKQPVEFDANAFAYAILKLKYGSDALSCLLIPPYYGQDFDEQVTQNMKTITQI